jgi:hypothetical protein
MGGKLVMSLVSVIAVAAIAGIGFAAYTSSASLTVNASAGSFYLVASGSLTASSVAVGSCYVSTSGNSLIWNMVNLLPGDYCNFTVAWTDAGSLPGTYVSYVTGPIVGPGCGQISVVAPWVTAPVPSVAAGGTAAAFYGNFTDSGNGQVAGACTFGPEVLTYAAA